jgi:hypothetical protein
MGASIFLDIRKSIGCSGVMEASLFKLPTWPSAALPFLWLSLNAALLVRANDTAINSGAHGPSPMGEFQGDESVIRMVSEKIDVTFGKETSRVHCRFVFRSGKKEGVARQTVGFPDMILEEGDAGAIQIIETRVNGKSVKASKKRGWIQPMQLASIPRTGLGEPPDSSYTIADFYLIEVEFPPDEDVVVERIYEASNGGSVTGNVTFSYNTQTGAVWRGTIGRAEIRVRLDGWTVENLAFEDGSQKIPPGVQFAYSSPNLGEWTIISPTELSMTWENFEPSVHTTRRGFFLTTWNNSRPMN